MQQGISTLEILDTAVKVGIGALISGVSTYLVTRLQQKGEIEQERRTRQAQLLQGIAEQVEDINHVYLKYWALITDAIRRQKSGQSLSEEKQKEHDETKRELFHIFKELTNAEAKLMLIGEEKASHLVRDYGNQVALFKKTVVIDENPLPDDEIEQWKEKIFEYRKKLFAELSTIYKKT